MRGIIDGFAEAGNSLAAAQVVAAFVTALATLALWRATKVLAIETSALAKMTAHPFVVCYLRSGETNPQAMNLTLENTGNATAFDIKLRIMPALPGPNSRGVVEKDETLFEASLLPPGRDLRIQAVMSTEAYGQQFSVEVSWAQRPAGSTRESLSYMFEPKDGFRAGWRTKGLHEIAEELEKVRRQMPSA